MNKTLQIKIPNKSLFRSTADHKTLPKNALVFNDNT